MTDRRAKHLLDDAWGAAVADLYRGGPDGRAVLERDDGFIEPVLLGLLLAPPAEWPSFERAALRYARGRVLDVGCGAGRHVLEMQRRGLEVVAVDTSPLTLTVARARGVRDVRLLGIGDVSPELGRFDTVVMLGHNLGLLEGLARGRRHLRRLASVTTDRARIIATTRDPYVTDRPEHRRYHARNRARGRLGGQIRMRVRYGTLADAWFDYLFVSRRELDTLLRGTGWAVARSFGKARPSYAVVIEKVAT